MEESVSGRRRKSRRHSHHGDGRENDDQRERQIQEGGRKIHTADRVLLEFGTGT